MKSFRARGTPRCVCCLKSRFWFRSPFLCSTLYFGGPVAVPAAAIECLIIKFDLCVCFDYCSVLTSEARRPWGDMSIAQHWWGSLSAAVAVCVCAPRACFCCDRRGQLLPAPLPWCFPTEKGRISERARGVLENETSDGCWQRPWKCMTTNAVMPVSDSAIST